VARAVHKHPLRLVNPAWIAAIVALTGIVVTGIGWLARQLWRAFQTIEEFREDWKGVAADSNHAARPGVLQRMNVLELTVADIQGQVHMNSGHSMRDEVQRIEATVESIQETVDELKLRP
jgi:hypothetical protein